MAKFTRKAIMQTFLHILKNKPLDRITVPQPADNLHSYDDFCKI